MKVGFTGTRKGMTRQQMHGLYAMLQMAKADELGPKLAEFHHGDCIGADYEANIIATVLGFFTQAHPPTDEKARAFCKCDQVWAAHPYMIRNGNIVDACDMLFAAPYDEEIVSPRSGTWATIRMAREANKKVVMLR